MEDDPDIQAVAALALRSVGGLSVEICGSAQEAIQKATSFEPDLILLDVMMPGTDGLTALKSFRRMKATAETPVVFMTAKVQPVELSRYRDLGSLGVVAKPFDPATLAETLREMWKAHDG